MLHIVLQSVLFVVVHGGGDACTDAVAALGSSSTCAAATDANTICTGDCRSLLDDIINNCDAAVSGYRDHPNT